MASSGIKDTGLAFSGLQEKAWIEVIHKMEEVYSDLLRRDVEIERKNNELEQTKGFIESILSAMSDILIVCDHKGRIQRVNAAVTELTGFMEAELQGQPLEMLFPSSKPQADLCQHMKGGKSKEYETTLKTKDGHQSQPVAVNCSTRFDERKRPAGMVLLGRPVGELRKAYEDLKEAQVQLLQAEKMASIGRLVAGVAHELNNPVSFIFGNVHTLNRYREKLILYLKEIGINENSQNKELRKKLKIDAIAEDLEPLIDGTLEGATRITEIVKNLRRLSFVSHGGESEYDLTKLVRNAAQWAATGRKSKALMTLEMPDVLMLEGHAGQMHQVMVNLIENAIDAVKASKTPMITITGDQEGQEIWLAISDNGEGIAPENFSRIFDPFFTTKQVGHGTGLGLWISYQIIKDSGGVIEAKNNPEGGASFTIRGPWGKAE